MSPPLRPVLRGWEGVGHGAVRCAPAQSAAVAFRWGTPGRFFYALRGLPMEVKQASRTVMDAQEINRALTRVAHEIIEKNHGTAKERKSVVQGTRGERRRQR